MSLSIRTICVALSILATVGASACGGEPGGDTVAGCVPAEEVAADRSTSSSGIAIAIAARDNRFEPSCVEVPVDVVVTLVVRNAGRHPHNLTLADGSAVAVDAGQVAFLDARMAGDAMRYECTIHPGMQGDLRPAR